MKAFVIILEILAALAVIAGVIYLIAAYGDRIVAWTKRLIGGRKSAVRKPDPADEDSIFDDEYDEDPDSAAEADFEG